MGLAKWEYWDSKVISKAHIVKPAITVGTGAYFQEQTMKKSINKCFTITPLIGEWAEVFVDRFLSVIS